MKIAKRLVLAALALALLVVVAGVVAAVYIDSIAKAAVERGGTHALGVRTTVASVDVGIFAGGVDLSALRVANPEGFSADPFLTLDDGSVTVSLGTLRKRIVEVPTLSLTGITVNLEGGPGKSNYGVILENIRKLGTGEKPSVGAERRYVVHDLEIRGVKVHANALPVGGDLTRVNVTLERIHLQNVGTAGQGVPLSQLASIIVQAVLSALADKGFDVLPADLLNDLNSRLAQLKSLDELGVKVTAELQKHVEKAIEGITKGAGKQIEETGKKIEEGIRGIIPRDKK